ncbi:MAG: nitrous oxide reductase accessory protein NosL [Halobacterium sp.]
MAEKTRTSRPEPADAGLSRRALIGAVGVTATAALAGCSSGGGESTPATTPSPVDLSGGKQDDVGGMVIGEHFGPNGQIFYRDHSPRGHDNPAWFMSLTAGFFPYSFRHADEGWTAAATYVTDYSAVDYELTTVNGTAYISSHTPADSFGSADQLTYVAGSEVRGGMGKTLVPFSDSGDADSFVSDHGGRRVSFSDVTPKWLDQYVRD